MSHRALGDQFADLPPTMTAREIAEKYQPWDKDRYGANPMFGSRMSTQELIDRKVQDTESTTDFSSRPEGAPRRTWAEGIVAGDLLTGSHPIWLQVGGVGSEGKPQIINGQHRVYTMLKHKPDEPIPVEHVKAPKLRRR